MKTFISFNSLIISLFFSISSAVYASPISVFWDFNGDQIGDSSLMISIGSTITADLYATVDNTHDGLISWGGLVSFSQAVVNANPIGTVTNNTDWFLPETIAIDNITGNVNFFDGRVEGLIGTLNLGTVTFDVVGDGTFILSMSATENQPFEDFVGADGFVYDGSSQLVFNNATISAIPVPASVFLFGSAVFGLMGYCKRKDTVA